MEENFYRMTLSESFLVLIILGLWLIAIINLARKLERICNPPTILPNYHTHNKTSLSPSTLHERYQPRPVRFTERSSFHLFRATSEPTIDASPRTTIHVRYPSETCLNVKSSTTQNHGLPTAMELRRSISACNLVHHGNSPMSNTERTLRPSPHEKLLQPQRIPSIVRRSLLDLHRRALYSSSGGNVSLNRSTVKTAEHGTKLVEAKVSVTRKNRSHDDATHENDKHKERAFLSMYP